jgi:hypothetical protein
VLTVVDVVAVVVVLRQLLLLYRCSLRFLSLRYHGLDLIGLLLLRNVLWRVVLRLLLRWHISGCQLMNCHASDALAGFAMRTNHLKFEGRRV